MEAPRNIIRTTAFVNSLKHLSKKHRGLTEAVDEQLRTIASAHEMPGDQFPGCGGQPVYKVRIAGNHGKDLRMIYYCAERLVLALFVFAKSDLSNIHSSVIVKALKDAGL